MIENEREVFELARRAFEKTGLASDPEYVRRIKQLEEREAELWDQVRTIEGQVAFLLSKQKRRLASKRQVSEARARSVKVQRQLRKVQGLIFRLHTRSMQAAVKS